MNSPSLDRPYAVLARGLEFLYATMQDALVEELSGSEVPSEVREFSSEPCCGEDDSLGAPVT